MEECIVKWLSLFSGIGGFDLALTRQGHEIVAACEIDKYARTVYSRHFPGVRIFPDATKLTGEEFGEIDGICAGFPCQAFSIAGKRLGFEESRGTLFFEIARLARQKLPRLLLLENVKGLLSHDGGKTFANILATLDELGYDAEWQVLNSKYFVPQNRERIFIIGHLRGTSRPQVFPVRKGNQINNGKIKKLTGYSQCGSIYDSKGLSPTLSSGTHGYSNGSIMIPKLNQLTHPKHSANRVYGVDGIARALKANTGSKTGLYAVSSSGRSWGRESRIKTGEANTLCTGLGGNHQSTANYVINESRIRRLTPLECERLQGFPDDYTEGLSDTQRYKCLGNAVTVPVIEYILERLK